MSATSPASRLHRHAIESIFGFLSLEDLIVVARVAREWSAATLSMAPLRCAFAAGEKTTATAFCAGRLRCLHVSTLSLPSMELTALKLLSDRVSHLTELRCTVDWASPHSAVGSLSFPRKLARLQIWFSFHTHSSWLQPILEAASQLSLESLDITVDQSASQISFTCLQSQHSLRSLTVRAPGVLSLEQLDEIRSLPWLSTVSLGEMDQELLCHVLRRPHGLQWARFPVSGPVTFAMGECLASLPLVSLKCQCEQSTRWMPLLAATLLEVDVSFELCLGDPLVEWQHIHADLCSLIHVTRLRLSCTWLSSADLALLVQSMSELRHLILEQMTRMESLSFLSDPKAPKLHSLSLQNMSNAVLQANFSAELAHIRSQTQLRSLSLCCVEDISPQERLIFAVPSVLMPELKEFKYSARRRTQVKKQAARRGR